MAPLLILEEAEALALAGAFGVFALLGLFAVAALLTVGNSSQRGSRERLMFGRPKTIVLIV